MRTHCKLFCLLGTRLGRQAHLYYFLTIVCERLSDNSGIELVPCIQTLGHLGQILQWPKYHIYRDTNEVLLGNWDETYSLIEKVGARLALAKPT